jgi:hypothetical protein
MSRKLLCLVADFIPGRFLGHEFVEAVLQTKISVEGVRCDRKALFLRKNLPKRRSADLAEATAIFVRGDGFEKLNVLTTLNPLQVLLFDEDQGTRANLATPRAMTGPHHGRFGQQLEPDRSTAAASIDHQKISPGVKDVSEREHTVND